MSTYAAIIFVAMATIVSVLLAGGFNSKAAFSFLFFLVIVSIPWFFFTRLPRQPSQFESIAATGWLWARRIICGVGAIFFLYLFVAFLGEKAPGTGWMEKLVVAAGCLLIAMFCFWVGVFGQGKNRADWSDDVKLHQENKQRYKWRW